MNLILKRTCLKGGCENVSANITKGIYIIQKDEQIYQDNSKPENIIQKELPV